MKVDDTMLTQIRKGVLELCILALISNGEKYGYEMIRELSSRDGLVTSEGTVYPILNRLGEEGLVSTVWRESSRGHPRKYYCLTEKGKERLMVYSQQWRAFSAAVDQLLKESGF